MTPSVTRIISPWVDFSKITPATLQGAAERGTLIHSACTSIALGIGWFPITNEGRAVVGYVNSFRRWFETVVAEVIFTERELAFRIHRTPGYAGEHKDKRNLACGPQKPACQVEKLASPVGSICPSLRAGRVQTRQNRIVTASPGRESAENGLV
jgi:hypothetical protein